jgi:Domain of unknown function (DUF4832)/Domain of unknown function (DUF4874)
MKLSLMFMIATGLTACQMSVSPNNTNTATVQTIDFEPSSEDFANPERGFFVQSAYDQKQGWGIEPKTVEQLKAMRAQNYSLLRMYYILEPWRESKLPIELLKRIELDFSRAREAGIKMIPRFAYNFGMFADAKQSQVLAHLTQLASVLRKNADVIAFMEAGFVGAWGEWHSSTNGLMNPDGSVNEASSAIIKKELSILPRNRTIAVRTPSYKFALAGKDALDEKRAFGGTVQARIAAHNDCFLASENNWGTYKNRQLEMDFYHQDNLFVPQGGETCNSQDDAKPYIGCENSLKELSYLRFSTLNIGFEEGVLNGWSTGDCLAQIKQKLGYRLRLLRAQIPDRVKPGSSLKLDLSITNDGFAAPFNPRLLELQLQQIGSGKVFKVKLRGGRAKNQDPRFWQPGQTYNVKLEVGVPQKFQTGEYRVLLALPDPEAKLYPRAEYAIRLANQNTWTSTGSNDLLQTIKIDSSVDGAAYRGGQWLR